MSHLKTPSERPFAKRDPVVEWNRTDEAYVDAERTLPELLARQAARTPGAVALACEGQELTYGELERRANQLARHLQERGVRPEALVGVCLERSVDLVVVLVGVLKAGGAYVPLDPQYPRDRLAFMVRDAQASILLTQTSVVAELPETDAEVITLDAILPGIEQRAAAPVELEAGPDNLAYVIYTSGSTGRPKGAMNAHRAIVNRLLWMQERYGLTPADVVLQKTPFSFDVSVWELFWPLMVGARLQLAQPGGHQDSAYLVRLIEETGVTVLHFVPSMLRVFLEEPELETRCRSIRHAVCSGESLTAELRDRFFACMGPTVELHNLYGPTEAAVDVTHWTCVRGSEERVVPIGRPVANTQMHVLDETLEPLPVGEPGELHIGGVQVARGYWRRPELTAERFIPDPFSHRSGARLYKTGDLARWRSDGAIEFLGRLDHQVKIRGNRIELGEIEAVLAMHPAVKRAAVIAREYGSGDVRLVAYVVPTSDERPGPTILREFLLDTLPDYMIPWAYVPIDAMPLSPSGKLDRKALPEPGTSRPELDQVYVAPRDAVEQFLASEWCRVLQIDRVGVRDRFFELGGSSIQAAQFVNRLQQELGEFIYITTIFESPTVAEYAAFLKRDYAAGVERRFGVTGSGLSPDGDAFPTTGRIDAAAVARLRDSIPVLGTSADRDDTAKNPPALFILSPPRSGTTLLRVMFAGHPDLFAAAELQLLGFNTLAERRAAYKGKFSLWLEGTIRAIMELKGCDPDDAKGMMAEYEEQGLSTKAFYRVLQEWAGGRMLVDKSPSYAFDLAALQKAEHDFENPLYVHLVRHPYSMVRSFESYHMDQVLYLDPHQFSALELGELVWTVSHQNILEFLRTVPAERQFRLGFEDLVHRPAEVTEEMCRSIGLTHHPELADPYKDVEQKMTNGLYADSTPMGDTKFLERKRIDPSAAESWRTVETDNFLGDITWEIAAELGYQRPAAARPGRGEQAARDTMAAGAKRRDYLEASRRRRGRRRGDSSPDRTV